MFCYRSEFFFFLFYDHTVMGDFELCFSFVVENVESLDSQLCGWYDLLRLLWKCSF
jgi:hypothetical protein